MSLFNKLKFIVLSLFLFSPSLAQDIAFSEAEKDWNAIETIEVVGTLKDKIVTYLAGPQQAQLIWYDMNMNRLGYTSLDYHNSSVSNVNLSIVNEEVHIFYQVKGKKHTYLWATKCFDRDEKFTPTLIDSLAIQGQFDQRQFRFVHHEKAGLHFYADAQNLSGKDEIALNMVVLDKDLQILHAHRDVFSTARKFEIVNINLDSSGRFYALLGEHRSAKKNYEELSLFSKGVRDVSIQNTAIDLKNYVYSGLTSIVTNKGLFLGGLFHEKVYGPPVGLVAMEYSAPQNELIKQQLVPILLQGKKGGNEFENLTLKACRLNMVGGYEFITEKFTQESRAVSPSMGGVSPFGTITPGNAQIERIYKTEDVYIFNVRENGSLNWTQSIFKNQESSSDFAMYASFAALEHPIGTVYFFNETNDRNPRIISSYLSSKGEMSLKQFASYKLVEQSDRRLILRAAKQISKDVLIVPSKRNADISFAKIYF